jgi:hypothetical protein
MRIRQGVCWFLDCKVLSAELRAGNAGVDGVPAGGRF